MTTFSESGLFAVKTVNGGTYNDVTIDASDSGSVHIIGKLVVNGTLTINASSSGTVLMPAKVTCQKLILKATHASNINSNDLEVSGACEIDVDHSSTCGLYMVVNSGVLTGSVKTASTLNLFVDFPSGLTSDKITADHTSVYSRRGWSGPSNSQATNSTQPANAKA